MAIARNELGKRTLITLPYPWYGWWGGPTNPNCPPSIPMTTVASCCTTHQLRSYDCLHRSKSHCVQWPLFPWMQALEFSMRGKVWRYSSLFNALCLTTLNPDPTSPLACMGKASVWVKHSQELEFRWEKGSSMTYHHTFQLIVDPKAAHRTDKFHYVQCDLLLWKQS